MMMIMIIIIIIIRVLIYEDFTLELRLMWNVKRGVILVILGHPEPS